MKRQHRKYREGFSVSHFFPGFYGFYFFCEHSKSFLRLLFDPAFFIYLSSETFSVHTFICQLVEYVEFTLDFLKRGARNNEKVSFPLQALLDDLHKHGYINSLSRWMDLYPKISKDERFDNMLGIPGNFDVLEIVCFCYCPQRVPISLKLFIKGLLF